MPNDGRAAKVYSILQKSMAAASIAFCEHGNKK